VNITAATRAAAEVRPFGFPRTAITHHLFVDGVMGPLGHAPDAGVKQSLEAIAASVPVLLWRLLLPEHY
jgi:hypothetical protein